MCENVGKHECHNTSVCVDTENSFECQCKEGYTNNSHIRTECKEIANEVVSTTAILETLKAACVKMVAKMNVTPSELFCSLCCFLCHLSSIVGSLNDNLCLYLRSKGELGRCCIIQKCINQGGGIQKNPEFRCKQENFNP